MATINSVLGPLDTARLGFTLMHEHVAGAAAGIIQNYPELLGDRFMDRAVEKLTQAKAGGIDTIVDASTFDLGRDVSLLAEASRRSGVNIIVTSGWFQDPKTMVGAWTADQFGQLFIREIQKGIAGTGIKAGVLKAAADVGGVTPAREIMLRAVARAHLQTGTPIMLHSYPAGQVGRQQLAILKEEGVNLRRVKVDHSLDTTNVEYLTWLLEQGCYLGLERCPNFTLSLEDQAKTLKALIDAGWAHRVLPSHDSLLVAHVPEMPPELKQFIEKGNPHGLLFIKKMLIPRLREMGVPERALNSLFIDGPRNFFEGV